jgi:hypothetical protein
VICPSGLRFEHEDTLPAAQAPDSATVADSDRVEQAGHLDELLRALIEVEDTFLEVQPPDAIATTPAGPAEIWLRSPGMFSKTKVVKFQWKIALAVLRPHTSCSPTEI